MDEILITPDTCMKFLVWSYFYHGITPSPAMTYAATGLFSAKDAEKLDVIKDSVFKCFDEASVGRALAQFDMAKARHEPCPFSQSELNTLFAAPLKS